MTGDAPDRDPPADRMDELGSAAGARHDDEDAAAPTHPLELALRYGLRYSGLREVALDPRLLLYVPLEVCEREMVLPLNVSDERIELATASREPDLELVQTRFPTLEIELVFAPGERVAELLDELKVVR
jgi:hypothetical protein